MAQVPNNLVQHGDLLNLPAVDARIATLEQVLAQAEDERRAEAERMFLTRLAGQIEQENKKIKEALNRVRAVEVDPHSSTDELQSAIDLLDSANNQLGALEDLYNQLDPENDQQNAIKTQAKFDQSALGEELGNTRQALQDRLAALHNFNANADDIEKSIGQLAKQIDAVQPEHGAGALDKLAALDDEQAQLGDNISVLANDALPALTPLQKPVNRVDELKRLHRDLGEQIGRLKNAAETAVQKQHAADEYKELLQQREEALKKLEREAEAVPPTTVSLKPLADAVAELVESIRGLEQDREAPSDELKERKSRLKDRANNLNQSLINDYKNAQNQENLLDGLHQQLEAVNEQLNKLHAKYQEKQPLDEAIRDKGVLEDLIIDNLSPLVASLNDVDDRNKRDEISRRIEEAKSNVDNFLTPLANEVKASEDLLKDYRDTLEALNRLGAEVLSVGASGDNNADLAKATALLDELRPLQLKAEELDAKRGEPTRFTQPSIAGESLKERVEQLQDELSRKRKALTDRIALEAVVPEIHVASEALQKRMDELAAPSEALPIETAESSIVELEEQRRRLETLLEKIPEGEAGDEIRYLIFQKEASNKNRNFRNKTSWNLNSLKDLLNRLTETVGDKMKALAAFLASKKAAEDQLADLNRQLSHIEAEGPQSQSALMHTLGTEISSSNEKINKYAFLEALGAEEARLNKLRDQFEEEHRPENLDDEKRRELDELKRSIDAASAHLQTVRENIQQNLRNAIQLEKLHADIARANNDLVSLTEVKNSKYSKKALNESN